MRLADFISANTESILAEWEVFARSIWPDAVTVDPATLRDHADAILRATVSDMASPETATERSDKSKGHGPSGEESDRLDDASGRHGNTRVADGFELAAVVAEYRALRASVLRLWRKSEPISDLRDLDDVSRFNASIDQSLTVAIKSYVQQVERERTLRLNEQAARIGAETANAAKDQFLAVLSHELRTPLNAIVGWLSILNGKGRTEKNLQEGLAVIERNTKAQVRLIEDVLDVSRIISGKLRLEMRLCELAQVVNAGVNAVRPMAESRGIALDVRLDPAAGAGLCDPERLQQIVWNLVSNAVKFTPAGGRVSVMLERDGSGIRLEVSDTGQGISADFLPHLFERFRQVDSSTRRKFRGLGIGLSIVKHVAELHGGTVEALSAGEGCGSTFIVRLPGRTVQMLTGSDGLVQEVLASTKSELPLVRLDGLRVLVVDDEADARRIMSRLLEEVGAIVTVAGSAAEALEALAEQRADGGGPDVLVSDIGMPGQDGYDLIREIRQRGHLAKDLPAIALTAYAQNYDTREALVAGFQVHIPKPVDPNDLTEKIARLVGRMR